MYIYACISTNMRDFVKDYTDEGKATYLLVGASSGAWKDSAISFNRIAIDC